MRDDKMKNKIFELQTQIGITKILTRFNIGMGYLLDIEQTYRDRHGNVIYEVVSLTIEELEQILQYAKDEKTIRIETTD